MPSSNLHRRNNYYRNVNNLRQKNDDGKDISEMASGGDNTYYVHCLKHYGFSTIVLNYVVYVKRPYKLLRNVIVSAWKLLHL